jgi:hypothetical protein
MSDLASSVGDRPTTKNLKSLFDHVLTLWPLAGSAPTITEIRLSHGCLRIWGGSEASATAISQEEILIELQRHIDSKPLRADNLRNACRVLGWYTQIPCHAVSGHSGFGVASSKLGTECPRPHTLSLVHTSVNAELLNPVSVRGVNLKWRAQEPDWSALDFQVNTQSLGASSAVEEMLEDSSAKTEWMIALDLAEKLPETNGELH